MWVGVTHSRKLVFKQDCELDHKFHETAKEKRNKFVAAVPWSHSCISNVRKAWFQSFSLLVTPIRWYRTRLPLHRDHFWSIVRPHLVYNHSWFVHQSSLDKLPAEAASTEAWRKMAAEFCLRSISFILVGIFKSYDMGPTVLLRLRTKYFHRSYSP
jgi:hypothetical protein